MGASYTPDDQALSLKLFVVLSKVYKVMMEHSLRDTRRHGLSPTEFAILELLYHKGRFPLQQIGGRILVTSGSITYNIDKLENKGYLKRVPCPEDRRVTYAELTDQGKRFMDEIFPEHAKLLQSAMSGLSAEEKQMAIDLLKKLGQKAQSRL